MLVTIVNKTSGAAVIFSNASALTVSENTVNHVVTQDGTTYTFNRSTYRAISVDQNVNAPA